MIAGVQGSDARMENGVAGATPATVTWKLLQLRTYSGLCTKYTSAGVKTHDMMGYLGHHEY